MLVSCKSRLSRLIQGVQRHFPTSTSQFFSRVKLDLPQANCEQVLVILTNSELGGPYTEEEGTAHVLITQNNGRKIALNSGNWWTAWEQDSSKTFIDFIYPILADKVAQTQTERKKVEASAEDTRKKQEQEQTAVMDAARLEKLKKLIKVSKKLKVSEVALILQMAEKDLYPRLIDWAADFGFILDEGTVDFGGGRKDDFMAQLDKEFASWGKQPGGKV